MWISSALRYIGSGGLCRRNARYVGGRCRQMAWVRPAQGTSPEEKKRRKERGSDKERTQYL